MLFYDLDLNAWIQRPGDSTPPWMTPALVDGGTYSFGVQFYRGAEIQDMGAATGWSAKVRVKGEYTGTPIGTSSSETEDGENGIVFVIDISSDYFTSNPTADSVDCVLAIKYTMDGDDFNLAALPVVVQQNYTS